MSRKNAAMSRVDAAENIRLYTYTNHSAKHSDTVTVLIHENRALIIDPSFPEYAERTKAELAAENITPETIILSHYHPDHSSGCAIFPDCRIYASEFYEPNFYNCQVWEPDFTYLKANFLIHHGDSLEFGPFRLQFHHAPGHSKCGIITEINDKIIHVGDLIMMTWERKNSLPYITDGGSFDEHIKSLKQIKELDPEVAIIPHGGLVNNKHRLHLLVDDRIHYLEKTLNSKGTLPLEECLKKDTSWYEFLEFHPRNLMHIS